jgi:Ca2+-binding EF-hand superfamily protein
MTFYKNLPVMIGSFALPDSEVLSARYMDMISKKKDGELRLLFDSFKTDRNDFVWPEEAVTILKMHGFDCSIATLKPFFDTFVADENQVKYNDLSEILIERLQEERRAYSYECALKKIDCLATGFVSVSDAINVLKSMTNIDYQEVMKEKELLILDRSKFSYSGIDFHSIVRRFHC